MRREIKKIISLLALSFSLILYGCASKIPENMEKSTYKYGTQAVKTYEDYAAGKIDSNEAYDTIMDLGKKCSAEAKDGTITDEEAQKKALRVGIALGELAYGIAIDKLSSTLGATGSSKSSVEKLNKLKEQLEMK
jgi:hypothetical protein